MSKSEKSSKYCYPGTDVLINKLNIQDYVKLQKAERIYSAARLMELHDNPIIGNFDLQHLQRIHKYIFQDIYDFAGKIRTEEISKENSLFAFVSQIENYFYQYITEPLRLEKYLKGLNRKEFSHRAAHYLGEINAVHPFREGNGRAQREFIRTLALINGFELDFSLVNPEELLHAFKVSFLNSSEKLGKLIEQSIVNHIPNRDLILKYNSRKLNY
ncbi:Fic/DOC family protein [Calidifontibacillus erzurumensis]|uniref:protein adenylyltransferase n=1 Tax=Calidifontibacillus erzurumensis TaxID=2741433 RepID=A0A8J8GHH7_9BACI|nr:Fic family protein [Calidifontibacillus erzurumensis]NSL51871.1 Fic family protein [Calidifontibacillus erzurumensis]